MAREKSTNVRNAMGRALVWSGRALSRRSPGLAARWATWWFFRTNRTAAPAAEKEALARGVREDVPFEGGRVAVWRWGRGPVVQLVHGHEGRAGQLRALVEPLVARGYQVVAHDAPGHGESSGSSSSLPQMARALRHVADVFGPVHAVVAHSLGGPATALAVASGLELDRVAFIGPPADAEVWFAGLSTALGLSVEAQALARRRIEARAGIGITRLAATELAPAVTMPLLVVHDRDDHEVPWSDGHTIARLAGGTLLTTTGLGHRRILGAPEVIDAIVGFVGPAPRFVSPIERDLEDRAGRWAQLAALAG